MIKFKEFIAESFTVPMHLPLASSALTGKIKDRFEASLINLQMAVKEGTIRKADLEIIKNDLNRACEIAWENLYSKPHMWGQGNNPNITKEEHELYYKDKGFRTMPSIVKNYTKFAGSSKIVAVAIQIASEFAPFKDIMDHLKSNMTTGRVPSTTVKVTNPNQIRGTCGWCLRDIAIERSGLMTHHGFTRPGYGYQTRSCSGIKFKNLEVSLDGLKARIKTTTEEKKDVESELARLPKITSVTIRKSPVSKEMVTIGKEDPRWEKAYKSTEFSLTSDIRALANELSYLNKTLMEWIKKHNA